MRKMLFTIKTKPKGGEKCSFSLTFFVKEHTYQYIIYKGKIKITIVFSFNDIFY